MEKEFNVTGSCNPQKHYMVDISHKFNEVMKLIEKGKYFTINRPRQYGKTTMLNTLFRNLQTKSYLVAYLSFEGIGDTIFQSEKTFAVGFLEMLSDNMEMTKPEVVEKIKSLHEKVSDLKSLSKIRFFCTLSHKIWGRRNPFDIKTAIRHTRSQAPYYSV